MQRLAEWVAVQSVSAWPEKRGEIKKMMEMAVKDIERLGGTAELVDLGKQKVGFLFLLEGTCCACSNLERSVDLVYCG